MIRNFLRTLLVVAAGLLGSLPAHAQLNAVQTWSSITGGSVNALTVTVNNIGSLNDLIGVPIRGRPNNNNTGASTLNVNGYGAVAIRKPSSGGPVVLTGGELVTTQVFEAVYDGTYFVLTSNLNAVTSFLVVTPQGYLTPCSGSVAVSGCNLGDLTPVSDVTGATTLYYVNAIGNEIPIWNGAQMIPYQVGETPLVLGSSNIANTLYDVCWFSNGGTPTIVTSVAWSSSGAGSSTRGTGAGSAQLAKTGGLWTNAVDITGRNGANTYSIPAGQCTYVATLLIDGTNGQVTFHRSVGQNRRWAGYNYYNQQPITLQVSDPTAGPWAPPSGSIRASNGSSSNVAITVNGLPGSLSSKFSQYTQAGSGSGNPCLLSGIGVNSTSAFSGVAGATCALVLPGPSSTSAGGTAIGFYESAPLLGRNDVYALEQWNPFQGTASFYGTSTNMLLNTSWRG